MRHAVRHHGTDARLSDFIEAVDAAAIIVVIAATGVLLMRFRKRWLRRSTSRFTNRITGLFQFFSPTVVRDFTRRRFPIPVRVVLWIVGADHHMELAAH
jgi:hypothetical protein